MAYVSSIFLIIQENELIVEDPYYTMGQLRTLIYSEITSSLLE